MQQHPEVSKSNLTKKSIIIALNILIGHEGESFDFNIKTLQKELNRTTNLSVDTWLATTHIKFDEVIKARLRHFIELTRCYLERKKVLANPHLTAVNFDFNRFNIPSDIWRIIISYLTTTDLVGLRETNTYFKKLIGNLRKTENYHWDRHEEDDQCDYRFKPIIKAVSIQTLFDKRECKTFLPQNFQSYFNWQQMNITHHHIDNSAVTLQNEYVLFTDNWRISSDPDDPFNSTTPIKFNNSINENFRDCWEIPNGNIIFEQFNIMYILWRQTLTLELLRKLPVSPIKDRVFTSPRSMLTFHANSQVTALFFVNPNRIIRQFDKPKIPAKNILQRLQNAILCSQHGSYDKGIRLTWFTNSIMNVKGGSDVSVHPTMKETLECITEAKNLIANSKVSTEKEDEIYTKAIANIKTVLMNYKGSTIKSRVYLFLKLIEEFEQNRSAHAIEIDDYDSVEVNSQRVPAQPQFIANVF